MTHTSKIAIIGLALILVGPCLFGSARQQKRARNYNDDSLLSAGVGSTEFYRWDIKSLDTTKIFNLRILSNGAFKVRAGIDTTGMAALKISGSGQYSASQFKRIADTLKNFKGDRKLYFIDLREESHCFANGYPISWFIPQNEANAGFTLKEVNKDQKKRFLPLKGKELTAYNKLSGEKAGEDCIKVNIKDIMFEKELVEKAGCGYLHIPCTDHLWPEPRDIDAFMDFYKSIDPDKVWLHFHCVAGMGRTGAFMCLYDMLQNPGVSYEDISKRQSALGANSLMVMFRNPARPNPKGEYTERISRLLYRYVQENRASGYKRSWSDWLAENDKEAL